MRLRSILISAIILVLLLAVSGAFLIHYGIPGTSPERIEGITVDQLAFRDADDRLLVLDHPGTVYLIDFVALGCEGCMRELPGLIKLPEEIGASGDFQLILVEGGGWRGQALRTLAEQFKIGSFPLY